MTILEDLFLELDKEIETRLNYVYTRLNKMEERLQKIEDIIKDRVDENYRG